MLRIKYEYNLRIKYVLTRIYFTRKLNENVHGREVEGEENEGMISASLSESLPNIHNTPTDHGNRGNHSADRHKVLTEESNSASKIKVKKSETKKLKKRESSMREEGKRKSQAEIRVTTISPPFPLITAPAKYETLVKGEVEKDPKASQVEIHATDISPSLPQSSVSVKQEMTPKKETEKKDAETDVETKFTLTECANCQVMRSELADVNAKVNKYETILTANLAAANRESEEDVDTKQGNPNITEIDNEEVEKWKDECEKLTSTLQTLQTETVQQISAYQVKLGEILNEREVMLAKLTKAEEKSKSLQAMLNEQREKNFKLSNAIQKMELKSVEELEKQKMELTKTAEANLQATEQLCRISVNKAAMFEEMLKKSEHEKIKLRRRLGLAADNLQNVEFGEMEPEEFHHQLEIKLNSLMEKFKAESKNPDLEWVGKDNIQYIMCGFEEVVKTILGKEPDLGNLAERLVSMLEEKNKKAEQAELSNVNKEDNVEAKAFGDFKAEMGAEIELMLEKFHVKQTEELNESICRILSCLENTEQKVDKDVVKRMDELGDLLLIIDSKQNALQKTEDRIISKMGNLSEAIESNRDRFNIQSGDRSSEITNLLREKHNFNAALSYVEQLGGDQLELKTRVRNMEANYAKLAEEMHTYPTPERPIVHKSIDSILHSTERRDMMGWPPVETHRVTPTREDENRSQKNTPYHEATGEAEKEGSRIAANERKSKSPKKLSEVKFSRCYPC
ncbi:unnamed protein product [Cercopithifilaria johnstoni]|uniref:Uncharacterized protein n=1 Tax=Cercopithifilaria johnstoni TaxID=2874296 RepID=A0A8J2Q8Y6_9BILA|nr:unnamed protein product [Cercopithifilaria johnstoni]